MHGQKNICRTVKSTCMLQRRHACAYAHLTDDEVALAAIATVSPSSTAVFFFFFACVVLISL
jgi:hypothetical protein